MLDRSQPARVILNPCAGKKPLLASNPYTLEDVIRCLEEVGLSYDLIVPESAEATVLAAREAVTEGSELLVAAGGDGTVSLVAAQVVGSGSTLGVLPLGTMMNIARTLRIPRDLHTAVKLLDSGSAHHIDVGEINGVYFFEAVSIGLSADLIQAVEEFEQGKIVSSLRLLWRLRHYQPVPIQLTIDGRTIMTQTMAVMIHNGPYIGPAFNVDPEAQIDDGLLDIIIFRQHSKWELAHHFAALAFGRHHDHHWISRLAGKRIRVAANVPLPVRADLRDVGMTPVEVRIVPQVLNVVMGSTPSQIALDQKTTPRRDLIETGFSNQGLLTLFGAWLLSLVALVRRVLRNATVGEG
jgi:YegS/Rv2252/BmrU family lipid kinase